MLEHVGRRAHRSMFLWRFLLRRSMHRRVVLRRALKLARRLRLAVRH